MRWRSTDDMREILSTWWHYLHGKRSEVAQMDYKDAYMAKVVMDIHRKRSGKRLIQVPLAQLEPIHRIDRENALRATRERTPSHQVKVPIELHLSLSSE